MPHLLRLRKEREGWDGAPCVGPYVLGDALPLPLTPPGVTAAGELEAEY